MVKLSILLWKTSKESLTNRAGLKLKYGTNIPNLLILAKKTIFVEIFAEQFDKSF